MRFTDVWTTIEGTVLTIKKITKDQRAKFEQEHKILDEERFDLLGGVVLVFIECLSFAQLIEFVSI